MITSLRQSPHSMPAARRFAFGVALAATLGSAALFAQIPGRNVNMVSGTTLPDGDPYLQRQNEPSIAASTRNPLHLLGGANDYRTVDVPGLPDGQETGDAWLGVFRSTDGGQRWKSTLIPGYPQDVAGGSPSTLREPGGAPSLLKGYQAGADPVVRAGTNGLIYYAGLVFDRGATGRSAIFVARFIDNNNTENGDPFAYLGTRIVAADPGTRFLDKPWLAVDVPRSGATCAIPAPNNRTQQIPAGPAYVSWTAITGTGANLRSQIFLSRSLNCGVTWSAPVVISRSQDPINQGSTIAIDPRTGAVIVAWRSFASPGASNTDSITAARSIDFGKKFDSPYEAHRFPQHGKALKLPPWVFEHRGKDKDRGDDDDDDDDHDRRPAFRQPLKFKPARTIDTLAAFDQRGAGDRFRTNGYPTMTIDGNGRVYVAWAERGYSTVRPSTVDGDAKIVMSSSSNGIGWTAPRAVSEASEPGHQFMPSLTFAGGKLMLIYYDLRDDKSRSFSAFADDTSAHPSGSRRTMDIRASLGTPGSAPVFAPSVKISDYARGSRFGQPGRQAIEQMQFNPPNLPMFKLGTVPFVGDYIDLTPAPAFVPDGRGGWTYNTQAGTTLPVFQAVWTDNRDVRPPNTFKRDAQGNLILDWTKYSPPISAFNPLASCDPGSVGSRNQNIYTSRITGGLIVGSPGNNKTLSASLQRAFVVFAQNTTEVVKTFRLTIASQPVGGRASFSQFAPLGTIDVTTAPRSLAARTVYVTSSNPQAQVQVDVSEISVVGGTTVAGGLQGTTYLNPDITNPDITNPDITNTGVRNPDITNAEVHNPDITNPDITNPDITNPDITNPDITNPDITNPDITNPDITNPDITNMVLMNPDITNPDITNPDITNPDITNPDITNPNVATPDITNGAITDVTWTMQNNGNTTTAYNVNLFLANQQLPSGLKFQLILHKVYNTPIAVNCILKLQRQSILVANIPNPVFVTPNGSNGFIDQNDPAITNPTLWLAPGEAGRVTLRLVDAHPVDYVTVNGAHVPPALVPAVQTITPVVVPQPVGSLDVVAGYTKPPIVTPNSPAVTPDSQTPNTSTILFLQQPTSVNVGQMIAVSVQVRDGGGAVVPNVNVTLSLVSNQGGATLTGGGPVATNANGVATFSGLSLDKVGTGYILVAALSSGAFTPATSAPFNMTMPPPPPPTFVRQPTNVNIGQSISPPVTVRALDGLGAALSGANVTLSLGANLGGATLTGGSAVVTDESGIATFTGLSLNAAGTGYTLVATLGVAPFPTATSASFNVTVPPPPPPTPPTANPDSYSVNQNSGSDASLLGFWPFNESGGATAFDLSGRGNNGLLVNAPAPSTDVPSGSAGHSLSFNGANQAVSVPNSLSLQSATSALTLSAWVKPGSGNFDFQTHGIISMPQSPGGTGWALRIENNAANFGANNGTANCSFGRSTGALQQGTWTHLAATFQANGTVKLYKDGSLIETVANVSGNPAECGGAGLVGNLVVSTQALQIGREFPDADAPGYPRYFAGVIDEARVYNRALSDSEVAALMQDHPLVVTTPGILANDTDPASLALTANLVTQPAHGTLQLNSDGSFTYAPAAGFSGTDSFTYRAFDGLLQSVSPATVTIAVKPINVPGTAGASANPNYPNVNVPLPDPVGTVTLVNGQTVQIRATGGVTWYSNHADVAGPNGAPISTNSQFLAPGLPAISLVARIGGGPWQFVGAGPTTLGGSGISGLLEFAINDSNYGETTPGAGDANTGSFSVTVVLGPPPPTLTVVGPAGGTGGSLFGPFNCAAGQMATALRGSAGDDIDYTELWCSPVSGVSVGAASYSGGVGNPSGGTNYGSGLTCGAGEVMTGAWGLAGRPAWSATANIIDTLGVTCMNLATGMTRSLGTVGNPSFGTSFTLSCPAGTQVVGIEGRQGGLMDAIAIRCQ